MIILFTDHAHTCACRRERTTTAFADDTDFLDLDDRLTPPSELYAGSGGKPPLTFQMETKSHKKKSVACVTCIVEHYYLYMVVQVFIYILCVIISDGFVQV